MTLRHTPVLRNRHFWTFSLVHIHLGLIFLMKYLGLLSEDDHRSKRSVQITSRWRNSKLSCYSYHYTIKNATFNLIEFI